MSIINTKLPPVYLVHGIRTHENEYDFDEAFAPYFHKVGFETHSVYYGHIWAVQARWVNDDIAEGLMDVIPDNAIVVAHSNGAAVAWLMDQMGKRFRGVILVNPALDRDKRFDTKFMHVYFNANDHVVFWSKFALFGHPWGDMGMFGPDYEERGVKPFDCQLVDNMPKVKGHTAIYEKAINRYAWGPFIAQQAFDEVSY